MSADYPLPDWAEDCCDQIDAGFFSGDSMESPAAAARMRHYLDRWETALDEIEARRRENTNCLEGMRCPVCGSLGPYMIDGTATFEVSDEGSSEFTNLVFAP